MNGRGVINYSAGKSSHGFDCTTTEFDDALMSRGIISFEQAMLAKGASSEEALRLCKLKKEQDAAQNGTSINPLHEKPSQLEADNGKVDDSSTASSVEEGDEDDNFLHRYRAMRLEELKSSNKTAKYGEIIPISRADWKFEVNDASEDGTWVVILLTAQNASPSLIPLHSDICQLVESTLLPKIAQDHPNVKFVSIPSKSAIPDFPEENLPALFCYQYGTMQHQLIGLEEVGYCRTDGVITSDRIEQKLVSIGVFPSKMDTEHDSLNNSLGLDQSYGRSHFKGKMATMATGNDGIDNESDYDDVD